MNNIQSDFKAKARMSTGFYNANGTPSPAFGPQMQMSFTGQPPPNSGPQMPAPPNMGPQMGRALGQVETAAFDTSNAGQATARAASQAKFDRAASGSTVAPEGLKQRIGANPFATAEPAARSSLARRAGRLAGGIGRPGLGGLIGAGGVALQGVAMDADDMRSDFYDDPEVSGFDKLGQGLRDVKTLALPAATGIVGAAASAPTVVGTVAGGLGGAAVGGATDSYIESALGESALDRYRVNRSIEGSRSYGKPHTKAPLSAPNGMVSAVVKPGDANYEKMMATKHGGIVDINGVIQAAKDSTFDPNANPFTRRATPEAEIARQGENMKQGGLWEATNNAFKERRAAAPSGTAAFGDDGTRELFNAKQNLEGTGITASKQANGVIEFSGNGDNPNGMRKLYRAADGSITDDWSKTKAYGDQIQRNAKDQDRLTELTRGAALSGDREAVQRLTAGDGRLQAIAADAATERDLRQAVRGGSAKAAQVLATMEASRATSANQLADLGLRRAALVGAQEDRDLSRQLRQDSLNERVASNRLSREKDASDLAMKGVETLDKQLEQYATVDGKLDGNRLSRIRGLAANLQKSPGQTDDSYRKDVTTLISLAGKLDDGQGWFDKLTSQAGNGGTDLRSWGKNESWRGGIVTDQGDHFSARQWNALSDDEKRMAKLLGMKGGK